MPWVAAAAAVVGAGVAIYGDIENANNQNTLDQEKVQIAQEQSAELGAREAANEALVNQTAMRQKMQFGASYAASGKSGVGIGSQLQIQNQADQQNAVSNRETQFQQFMLAQQAGIDTTMGQQSIEAGNINALGSGIQGISGAARVYNTANPPASPPPAGWNG
jgi:hypothetical protein